MMARPVRMPAKSKYHAQPTVVDGIRFDSKREAQRYGELKLLEKAGQIEQLILQPRFSLDAYDEATAATFQPLGTYVADFAYLTADGETIVEDVKGFRTPLYKWKKKHVEAQYGITVREVR